MPRKRVRWLTRLGLSEFISEKAGVSPTLRASPGGDCRLRTALHWSSAISPRRYHDDNAASSAPAAPVCVEGTVLRRGIEKQVKIGTCRPVRQRPGGSTCAPQPDCPRPRPEMTPRPSKPGVSGTFGLSCVLAVQEGGATQDRVLKTQRKSRAPRNQGEAAPRRRSVGLQGSSPNPTDV